MCGINPEFGLEKKQNVDAWETFLMTSNRPQNLTQGRSRHAEAESEVKSWRFLHPEAKIKENVHIEVVVTFSIVNFFSFFGHSSLSHRQIVTKIGGKTSYRPPGPS